MMVTAAMQPPGPDLNKIFQKLTSTAAEKTKLRTDIYNKLVEEIKDGSLPVEDCLEVAAKLAREISSNITSEELELSSAALQALGFFVFEPKVVKELGVEDCQKIIKTLCQVLLKCQDKTVTIRALWCLSKQNFPEDVIDNEILSILCAIEHICNRGKFQAGAVDHETINAINRLLHQVPESLAPHTVRWAKFLPFFMVHSAPKVRERGLGAMETAMPLMMRHQTELVKILVPDLKLTILGEMKKLFGAKQEIYIMKVWSLIVKILGKAIHHGNFINSILVIAEQAFKHNSTEVKCAAFEAWQFLIDNFATNPDILCDNKRIKLIMQVFRLNNAKNELLAQTKLRVWWHFIIKLGDKASQFFDQTCAPLLHFALGLGQMTSGPNTPSRKQSILTTSGVGTPTSLPKISGAISSPGTPRLNLSVCGSVIPTFNSVQLKGCEILSQFLGKVLPELDLPKYTYTLESLPTTVVTGPVFFAKHMQTFISAIREAILLLGDDIPAGLLYSIWYSLLAHCKNVLNVIGKKEGVDTLSSLLAGFQMIVMGDVLESSKILKLFEVICCLPPKSLSSHFGNAMHGTPALYLLELLLTQGLVEKYANQEKFFQVYETLIGFGFMNQATVLDFCQSVLQLLDNVAPSVEDKESLWRLWSYIAKQLTEHILKTNEVNQGDSLEHNFSCMYQALMLPISKILPHDLTTATTKTLLRTWGEMYRTFARLAALVTNAEANICCEELCSKVLATMNDTDLENLSCLETLGLICQIVTEAIDFSTFSNNFGLVQMAVSPIKWAKRKNRPLGNLHSLVKVIGRLMEAIQEGSMSKEFEPSKQKSVQTTTLQSAASNVIGVADSLFTHVTQSAMVSDLVPHLANPVGTLLEGSAKKMTNKLYSASICNKLEKLWQSVSSSLQTRYTGPYDSDFLEVVAPLLQAVFLHPKRQMRTSTNSLWNATFANASLLKYPETLKPVLMKVKEKTPIILPGWQASEIPVICETPVSQMSQVESQAPMPDIPGMSSPHRIRGSFLNKVASPDVKNSPLKSVQSPAAAKRKLKMSVNDLKDEDFVVIAPSPKKKMVLTEHQKEVLKERSAIPAMYSTLDASQDRSLASQFFSTSSQMESSSLDTSFSLIKKTNQTTFKKPGEVEKPDDKETKEKADVKETKEKADVKETKADNKIGRRRRSVKFFDENEPKKKNVVDENDSNAKKKNVPGDKIDKSLEKEKSSAKGKSPVAEVADSEKASGVEKGSSQKEPELENSGEKSKEVKLQNWELDMNGCFETEMDCEDDATQAPSLAPSASVESNSTASFQFHGSDGTLAGSPRKNVSPVPSEGSQLSVSQVSVTQGSQSMLMSEPRFTSQPFESEISSENAIDFGISTLEGDADSRGASDVQIVDDDSCSSSSQPLRRSRRRASIQKTELTAKKEREKARKKGKGAEDESSQGKTKIFGVPIETDVIIEETQTPEVEKFNVFGLTDKTPASCEEENTPLSQLLFSESPSPVKSSEPSRAVVLVEETQSPEKFKQKFQSDLHNESVAETPLKDLEPDVPIDGSPALRNLFSKEKVESLGEKKNEKTVDSVPSKEKVVTMVTDKKHAREVDTPSAVKCMPLSVKVDMSPEGILIPSIEVKLNSTPVVKLKKLTDAEIEQFSPTKLEDNGFVCPSNPDRSSGSQGSRSKKSKKRGSVSLRFSRGGQDEDSEELAQAMETDDFIPSSQGFDLSSSSSSKFTSIKYSGESSLSSVEIGEAAGTEAEPKQAAPSTESAVSESHDRIASPLEDDFNVEASTDIEDDVAIGQENSEKISEESVPVSEEQEVGATELSEETASEKIEEIASEKQDSESQKSENKEKRSRGRPRKFKLNNPQSNFLLEENKLADSQEEFVEKTEKRGKRTKSKKPVGLEELESCELPDKKGKKGESGRESDKCAEVEKSAAEKKSLKVQKGEAKSLDEEKKEESSAAGVETSEAENKKGRKAKKGEVLKLVLKNVGLEESADNKNEESSAAGVETSGAEDKKGRKTKKGKEFAEQKIEKTSATELAEKADEKAGKKLGKKKKLEANADAAQDDNEKVASSKKKKKISDKVYEEDIFNKKCNLDVDNDDGVDDDDDVPINKLVAKKLDAKPESVDLFESEDKFEDSQSSQSGKKKKRLSAQSELNRLQIDMVFTKSTRSMMPKRSKRLSRSPLQLTTSAKKLAKKKQKIDRENEVKEVDECEDNVVDNEETVEKVSESEEVVEKLEKVPEVMEVDELEKAAPEEKDLDLPIDEIDLPVEDPEIGKKPEIHDLITRPILIQKEKQVEPLEPSLQTSPQKEGVPNEELQETPRSSHKKLLTFGRRRGLGSPSLMPSRGMKLLELASQSATKKRPEREELVSSTPKTKRKPGSCMTDPVRPCRLSRVDLILRKSKEVLAKRESANEDSSTPPPSSPANVPVTSATRSPASRRRTFRPITVGQIYSPSASPSAGILKKRKLDEVAADSPSPPNKQRRVSFAESVDVHTVARTGRSSPKPVNRCLELPKGSAPPSPLVADTSSASEKTPATSGVDIAPMMTSTSGGDETFATPTTRAVKRVKTIQSSPSLSPMSCQSTQELQLNATDPVYPNLLNCLDPVDLVLPQLTSSTWSRGLGNMMKARNITTIGKLAALTEYEVHNLPLRTPKIETLRNVLEKHRPLSTGNVIVERLETIEEDLEVALDRLDGQDADFGFGFTEDTTDDVPASPTKDLPSVEAELATLSPTKGAEVEEEEEEEDMDTTIEMLMENSAETLSNVTKLEVTHLPTRPGLTLEPGSKARSVVFRMADNTHKFIDTKGVDVWETFLQKDVTQLNELVSSARY